MLGFMPVEFLTYVQAAAYSRFTQPPSLAELERFFFLDDTDMALVNKRRGDYNRPTHSPRSVQPSRKSKPRKGRLVPSDSSWKESSAYETTTGPSPSRDMPSTAHP
ncbi:DUF4158 domain-containing protein [Arthrobacter sp. RHLT1-20]